MIKRYINLILIALLVISMFSLTSFASGKSDGRFIEAKALLEGLEILRFSEEELSEGITRGEFAGAICKIKGFEAPGIEEESEERLNSFINTLSVFKIVSGYSDGSFGIYNKITFNEAYTMLVRALGFGSVAEDNGGYPGGYVKKAAELKLNREITSAGNRAVSKKEGIMLIYNALFSEYLELSAIGDEKKYTVASGKTLLSEIFDVYYKDGILDGIDLTRLAGKNDVKPWHISVDGFEIERADYNFHNLLGYKVRAYYKQEKDESPTLVTVISSESNKDITVNIDDILRIASDCVEYYADGIEISGKTSEVRMESFKYFIYNGTSTDLEFNESLISGKNGEIKFIDNDSDGKYEIICADVYEDYVVSQVDSGSMKIYDKINPSLSIKLDVSENDPYTVIFNSDMTETGIDGIKSGDVVSIYKSASDSHQAYIRAFISSDKLTGIISTTENDCEKITVNDIEYTLTETCRNKFENSISAGGKYDVYFNKSGKVAYLEKSIGDEMLVGYLKKIKAENTIAKTGIMLRICTLSGKEFYFNTYNAAENITLDGIDYKLKRSGDIEKISELLNIASKKFFGDGISSDVTAQFIKYELNENGEVRNIDTILSDNMGNAAKPGGYESIGNEMYFKSGENLTYRQSTSVNIARLGDVIHIRRNTVVFNYPFPSNTSVDYLDENLYFMGDAENSFTNVGKCEGTLHAIYTEDKFRPDYLGREYSEGSLKSIGTHDMIAVVDRVYEASDEDNGKIYKIEVYGSNKSMTFKAKKDFTFSGMTSPKDDTLKSVMKPSDLKHGDMIRYIIDKDNYLTALNFYYRPDNDITNPAYFTNAAYNVSIRFSKAYVMKKFEDGFLMSVANDLTQAALTERESWEYISEYDNCYIIYDEEKAVKNRVSISSMNELKAYEDVGVDCSEIIIHQYNGTPFGVYIIKR